MVTVRTEWQAIGQRGIVPRPGAAEDAGGHRLKGNQPSPARWLKGMPGSGDDLASDLAGDVGQSEVSARIAVGQPLVVEPQEVQDRRVDVVEVHFCSTA